MEVEKQLTDDHQVHVVFWGNLKKIALPILHFYFPLVKQFIMKQLVYLNFIWKLLYSTKSADHRMEFYSCFV